MRSVPPHPLGYLRKRSSGRPLPPLRIPDDGSHKTARSYAHADRVRNDPEPAMMPAAQVVLTSLTLMMWLSLATTHADTLVKFPNVPGHAYPPYLLGYLARPDGRVRFRLSPSCSDEKLTFLSLPCVSATGCNMKKVLPPTPGRR